MGPGRARAIAMASGVLLLAELPLLSNCADDYGTERPAGSDEAGTSSGSSSSSGGTSGAGTSGSSGGTSGAADARTLAPGEIVCAGTAIVCDTKQTFCCLAVSGSEGAVRSYTATTATCQAGDPTDCRTFVGVGNDFTMKFAQTCGADTDCTNGAVCCVLPREATDGRFSKTIGSISCVSRNDCDRDGRTICANRDDCSATENCLPETDPILVRVYASFCR